MKENGTPDVFITLRVPPSLHKQLKALAQQNDRQIAAEARIALRAHIAASMRVNEAEASAA